MALSAACGSADVLGDPEPGAVRCDRGVSYDAFYLPFDVAEERIRADLQQAHDAGATSVYVTASEADVKNDRKVSLIVAYGHELGLRVFLNPYVGGTFSFDEGGTAALYLERHPDEAHVSRSGASAAVPSIAFPQYRSYLKDTLTRLFEHDFDGLLLDEPTFPTTTATTGDYFPYDVASQERFMVRYGRPMPDRQDENVARFREELMTEFLAELFDHVGSIRPEVLNILVVLPSEFDLRDARGSEDWHALSRIPTLDVFQIDPYWYPGQTWDWYAANLDRLAQETDGSGVLLGVWVRAYGLDGEYDRISRTLAYAKERGIPWLASWVTDAVPNKDPAAAWREIARVYGAE